MLQSGLKKATFFVDMSILLWYYSGTIKNERHKMTLPKTKQEYEELTDTGAILETSYISWCKVCDTAFMAQGHCDRDRLVSAGICAGCDRNVELFNMRDKETTVRIDGQHYIYAAELHTDLKPDESLEQLVDRLQKENPERAGKGMGGRAIIIRFFDGRTVITNDLWHQGAVPESMAEVLTDNAEFVA